jgi:8-oxo-dGTP pyrophosphatase MutT (NUDIX family)
MSVTVTFVGSYNKLAFTGHGFHSIMTVIMFQYCPSCGTRKIQFKVNRFFCPDCGFVYFHNTAAATGCVIQAGERVLLLTRGKEPALGKLDLPGGFVDPGEGVLDGLRRELREELGWEPPIPPEKSQTEVFTMFASFPNTYLYKNIPYNTCDLYFTVSVPGLTEKELYPEAGEIAGIRFLRPGEIDLDDLAFDSTRRAIDAFRKLN